MLGNPAEYARRYSRAGWELLFIDIVASLYGRNHLEGLLSEVAGEAHVPITIGGGCRSLSDAKRLFDAGADKVAACTAVCRTPELISQIASRYGSQALTVSIQAKRTHASRSGWEAYTDNGRERTGREVGAWADEACDRGAGELLLTSVDMDGTRGGFDLELIESVAPRLPIPVIAGGGCGSIDHIRAAQRAGADGVAVASVLHYGILTQEQIENEIETQAHHEGKYA